MLKQILKITEVLGVAVLLLIIIAFIRTPEFFTVTNPSSHWIMYGMLGGIIVGTIVSVVRLYRNIPYHYLVGLGLILIILGGYVFVFMPEYFYTGMALPLSYWL